MHRDMFKIKDGVAIVEKLNYECGVTFEMAHRTVKKPCFA